VIVLNVGIDASMLVRARTGVGNYVFNLLERYSSARPASALVLFSNTRVSDDARGFGECVDNVYAPARKGPLWMSTGLPPLLRKHRIDVFWGGNGFLPAVVPRGLARVVTIHDFVYRHAADTLPRISLWARRVLQPLAIRQADAVLCVSHSTAAELRGGFGRTPDAVVEPLIDPIYRPATREEIDAVSLRYALPSRFLLTIGTLEPRKNIVTVLRAYARVRDSGIALPPLVLAGKRGWLGDDIRSIVEGSIERGFARFLDYVPLELMPALYSAAETFLFLPLYEGFGMPPCEALRCGTPVIAADIPALREATRGLARLVPPDQLHIENVLRDYSVNGPTPRCHWPDDLTESPDVAAQRFAAVLERAVARDTAAPRAGRSAT
jgi:glycosyltransferase involved in cell wall biosynthesis